MKKVVTTNKKPEQMFRMCCSCVMVTLIKKGKCSCCGGSFILSGLKDDLEKRPKRYAETH